MAYSTVHHDREATVYGGRSTLQDALDLGGLKIRETDRKQVCIKPSKSPLNDPSLCLLVRHYHCEYQYHQRRSIRHVFKSMGRLY